MNISLDSSSASNLIVINCRFPKARRALTDKLQVLLLEDGEKYYTEEIYEKILELINEYDWNDVILKF
jgi:hypothetical protein